MVKKHDKTNQRNRNGVAWKMPPRHAEKPFPHPFQPLWRAVGSCPWCGKGSFALPQSLFCGTEETVWRCGRGFSVMRNVPFRIAVRLPSWRVFVQWIDCQWYIKRAQYLRICTGMCVRAQIRGSRGVGVRAYAFCSPCLCIFMQTLAWLARRALWRVPTDGAARGKWRGMRSQEWPRLCLRGRMGHKRKNGQPAVAGSPPFYIKCSIISS